MRLRALSVLLAVGAVSVSAVAVAGALEADRDGAIAKVHGDQPAEPPLAYRNRLFGGFDFPDPMVLDNGGRHDDYYAYATGDRFPVLHSSDLVNWRPVGRAMQRRPAWATTGPDWRAWAPSVIEKDGACPGGSSPRCYVMYYVAFNTDQRPHTNCIGVATAEHPAGPFSDRGILQDRAGTVDSSGRPIGCGDNAGYSNIDPAPFVDTDGSAYLYLSTSQRCSSSTPPNTSCPNAPRLSVVRLTPDLLHAAAPRLGLLSGDQQWERAAWASVVENPWLHRRGATYYLFYSGGDWASAYGMGYARSSSPTGPFVKEPEPIMRDSASVVSAGGGSLVVGPGGGDWLSYHGRAGSYAEPRSLRVDPIRWGQDGRVAVDGPSPGHSFLP